MKTTIKLIQNIFAKLNLISNLTAKNLALHQQLFSIEPFYQKITNQDQKSLVLDQSLSLLE